MGRRFASIAPNSGEPGVAETLSPRSIRLSWSGYTGRSIAPFLRRFRGTGTSKSDQSPYLKSYPPVQTGARAAQTLPTALPTALPNNYTEHSAFSRSGAAWGLRFLPHQPVRVGATHCDPTATKAGQVWIGSHGACMGMCSTRPTRSPAPLFNTPDLISDPSSHSIDFVRGCVVGDTRVCVDGYTGTAVNSPSSASIEVSLGFLSLHGRSTGRPQPSLGRLTVAAHSGCWVRVRVRSSSSSSVRQLLAPDLYIRTSLHGVANCAGASPL